MVVWRVHRVASSLYPVTVFVTSSLSQVHCMVITVWRVYCTLWQSSWRVHCDEFTFWWKSELVTCDEFSMWRVHCKPTVNVKMWSSHHITIMPVCAKFYHLFYSFHVDITPCTCKSLRTYDDDVDDVRWSTCCKMLKQWLIVLLIWHDILILQYVSMQSGL